MTSIESSGAEIMPPTMGAAMRCITSDPVPLPHMIGKRPARITATVMALGRTRSTAPSKIAAASAAMALSSVSVVTNALLLKRWRPGR